jgi:cysteine desulfurase/selenocysteine lyase
MTRRKLLQLGAKCGASFGINMSPLSQNAARSGWYESGIRSRFPALNQAVQGKPLTYFDTAATAQKPLEVINAIASFYSRDNANPAPNLHFLAKQSFDAYQRARLSVAKFLNASDPSEIVWTRGTTEAINLVASSWGESNIHRDDEIVLTIAEHASNMLPWQLLARRKQAHVRYVDLLETGHLDLESLKRNLGQRTKLVCFSHVSNVLGIINEAAQVCQIAHAAGAKVLIDAAQSVPHIHVDVQQLDCDFLAFSGHKIMGPMGIGVLWVKRALLDEMPPYQTGSNMAHALGLEEWEYSDGASKFGAGTPNVSGPVGLAAALEFIRSMGYEAMWKHEQQLTTHLLKLLSQQKGLRILGEQEAPNRISLVSFSVESVEAEIVARKLDEQGIAIRAGDLASLALLERFGVKRAARVSLYLYNSVEEIDNFVQILAGIIRAA